VTSTPTYSLEALERRWELEKTPQIGLRLAEQYGFQEKISAAIETLVAGLEVYPTHTASRVALSRHLVDAGRFDEAVPHLEQIVVLDPAHLVANKLLVETYAEVGRTDEARDKLAIYEMMGEGDSDIERLHELLEVAERREKPQSTEPRPAGGPEDVPIEASEGVEHEADQPFSRPNETDTPFPRLPVAASSPAEGDQPFAQAWAQDNLSDYWQAVADEGIFAFEPPEAPEEPVERDESEQPSAAGDSTVTLGELYREQGHSEEAVEVFEEVLAREPENRAAQRGLEVTREPAVVAVPVVPFLAVDAVDAPDVDNAQDEGASEPSSTPGLLERKKLALTSYLGRIRQADTRGL